MALTRATPWRLRALSHLYGYRHHQDRSNMQLQHPHGSFHSLPCAAQGQSEVVLLTVFLKDHVRRRLSSHWQSMLPARYQARSLCQDKLRVAHRRLQPKETLLIDCGPLQSSSRGETFSGDEKSLSNRLRKRRANGSNLHRAVLRFAPS